MAATDQLGYECSIALQHSAVVWTEATSLGFIVDPPADMFGSQMNGPAMGSGTQRRAILTYVRRFRPDGTTR